MENGVEIDEASFAAQEEAHNQYVMKMDEMYMESRETMQTKVYIFQQIHF